MHSHRSFVLVPALILAGACSKGENRAVQSSPLDRDLTLSAQLQGKSAPSGVAELVANGACRAERAAPAPTAAKRSEALALEQRAAEAEFAGNIEAARALHRQAARLDATSEAISYRLARADEASGDSAAAVAGYCHYLSLAPTAANAQEVRTRLSALLGSSATTRLATAPAAAPVTPGAVATPVRRASGRRVATNSVSAAPVVAQVPVASSTPDVVAGSTPATTAGTTESTTVSTSTGEVVATNAEPVARTTPSEPAPQVRRPADHTARNAAIGAAAGAAVGAMTSRSVKGAVIGGAAGAVLGAVVGRASNSGFRTPGFSH